MPDTSKFMSQVRRKVTKLVKLENAHGGQEEGLRKATEARHELEDFIENEHRRLSVGGPG